MNEDGLVAGRWRSLMCACAGIATLLKSQTNARVHALATVVVFALGMVLGLPLADWCWIVAAVAWVWIAEALNSALEFLADVASPEWDPLVKKAKDVAAAAVLIAVFAAVMIGLLVLGPPLLDWLGWAGG